MPVSTAFVLLLPCQLLHLSGAGASLTAGFNAYELEPDPEFIGQVENVTVAQGRDAVLTCSVKHLGPYKVGWLKADTQTILALHKRTITTNRRISMAHDQHRAWSLHVRGAVPSDAGCYMCQINTALMKKQLGCLTVQVPPVFDNAVTSQDVNVVSGDNVTLTCHADGDPKPSISWRREDGRHLVQNSAEAPFKIASHQGDRLDLQHVSRHHAGAYLCIASNDVPPAISKRILVNVAFAPVVRVSNPMLGAPRGSDVTLECQVESSPLPSTYWLRRGETISSDGTKYVLRETHSGTKTHVALRIRDFHPRDAGLYTCIASNTISRAEGYVRLHEIYRPTPPPSGTVWSVTVAPRRPALSPRWHQKATPPPRRRPAPQQTSTSTPARRQPGAAVTSRGSWVRAGEAALVLSFIVRTPALVY